MAGKIRSRSFASSNATIGTPRHECHRTGVPGPCDAGDQSRTRHPQLALPVAVRFDDEPVSLRVGLGVMHPL
jgi:hypothetical protein